MNPIKLGLMVLVAAVTCSAVGYFAGRASAQAPQPRLTESQYNAALPRDVHPDSRGRLLMGDYTETAVLLTVNDAHLPYDVPSLMPVP